MATNITVIILYGYFYYFQQIAVHRGFGMKDALRNMKNPNTTV